MAYMNLPKEEKSSTVVYKTSGGKTSFYDSMNNRERVVLRACLLDKSLEDLKLLVGYDDDNKAAAEFMLKLLSRANPLLPLYIEAGELDEKTLLNIKTALQMAFTLKDKKWWQRIF